ncbi:MAG: type II secretion system F family protein [Vicinamibacterales bacterium]|nr:type II secretion system F family protein [Vicinamibacterales bacterium]
MPLALLVVLAFVSVSAAVFGGYMLLAGRFQAARDKSLEKRLHEASGIATDPGETPDASMLRAQSSGPLPDIDRVARRVLKGSSFELWMEQSGTGLTVSACLLISLMLGGFGAMVAWMIVHKGFMAPIGFAIGVIVLPAIIKGKRTKRLYKFEEFFPEALDLLSRGIRAGHAFSAGMKMVAEELGEPVGPEFRKAFDEQNFGLPLKESLNNLCMRVPLLDVRFFATAVLIQRETGGNLSEILDNLAAVVRERFKIRRQVRVHTAHGRFTGYVLMALPAFLAVALSFINPDHMKMLFEERMGQFMIVASIVMQAVGFFWIRQVIKIEV